MDIFGFLNKEIEKNASKEVIVIFYCLFITLNLSITFNPDIVYNNIFKEITLKRNNNLGLYDCCQTRVVY